MPSLKCTDPLMELEKEPKAIFYRLHTPPKVYPLCDRIGRGAFISRFSQKPSYENDYKNENFDSDDEEHYLSKRDKKLLTQQKIAYLKQQKLLENDPFGINESNKQYSLNKKKRWLLLDYIEEELPNLQHPSEQVFTILSKLKDNECSIYGAHYLCMKINDKIKDKVDFCDSSEMVLKEDNEKENISIVYMKPNEQLIDKKVKKKVVDKRLKTMEEIDPIIVNYLLEKENYTPNYLNSVKGAKLNRRYRCRCDYCIPFLRSNKPWYPNKNLRIPPDFIDFTVNDKFRHNFGKIKYNGSNICDDEPLDSNIDFNENDDANLKSPKMMTLKDFIHPQLMDLILFESEFEFVSLIESEEGEYVFV